MDIDILHDKLFSISKYCPISNSNVNTVVTDINNVESNTDSDNSNEIYNYTNSNSVVNNSNSIDSENRNINISDSENNNIVTNNVVNRPTGDNRINISNFLNNECVNIYVTWYRVYNFLLGGRDAEIIDLTYKTEWDILFNNQIISGNYSKIPFLVRSAALLTEIMPKASTRQGLLFRRYKCKLTRSVNADNAVRQASRATASEGDDDNFFVDCQLKP